MAYLKEVLKEELQRLERIEQEYESQLQKLPKGSIVWKQIKGKLYPYLLLREGRKVKTEYIKASEVEELTVKIEKRRKFEKSLQNIREDLKIIRKIIKP